MNARSIFPLVLLAAAAANLWSDSFDPKLFAEMRWRSIGPYRGGRTKAATGVPGQPNVFYIGAVNGGVWKSNDYGRTWSPLFDDQPTGSIGDIAVAASDPNVVYVASGEGLQRPDLSTGDGIYKSNDAGKSWTHLGLREGQQIPRIAVDPRNANRLFVAVLGHPYGPNAERGVFRSTDGGQTFQKVLYKDENTGASDVELDPSNPEIVYAALWEARQGPWENAAWSGTGGGIFKSTDGGATWKPLTRGLPSGEDGIVQAGIAVSPSEPARLYASVATVRGLGIYRSDDAGENWYAATADPRPAARIGGGDLPVLTVDPKNADTVYSASVVTWKSTDGGKTWTGIRGAPGGDDYQRIWINPLHPEILLIASDQGAIVTVNGGQTWSSWFNQPTAQMYHATTDNAFPYRVCGGQQESGSACVASRGMDGEITFRDWRPAGVEEYGYAAPDPLDPDVVYGGKLTRFDRRTTQVETVHPKPVRSADFRTVRTAPVVFSPVDPHTLFFAGNTLWKTRDGGRSWRRISPDLTRKTWAVPASVGKYRDTASARPTQRGVIYAIAPSPLDANRIWAGTDDGLIHVTIDGGLHWKDVTPPQLVPWAKVSILEAGHFDAATCYAAINTLRLDDLRPHILSTHDGGKTWTEIAGQIPDGANVNAVREDTRRKGLLFAGTERAVYVSFDDGAQWQSLRLNMPATSIRDLTIKDGDLVAATHGRGFWILDDIAPLRQMERSVADAGAFLFRPEVTYRARWNTNTDTPLPPDEPAGQNGPDGAILDYYLGAAVSGPVTLEILDSSGSLVRRYSSTDAVDPVDPMLAIPKYWVRPERALPGEPGLHRFAWDLHYAPRPHAKAEYPMEAVVHDTAPAPTSPWVLPGAYTVKLIAGGRTYTQPLTIKMDPRVRTTLAGLRRQFTASMDLYRDIAAASGALDELRALRVKAGAGSELDRKAAEIGGSDAPAPRFGPPGPDTLTSVTGALNGLMQVIQSADVAPTPQMLEATAERRKALANLLSRWIALKAEAGTR